MTNKEIALNILNQLGGYNRLNIMLGLKDVLSLDNGVSFKFKVKSPINYVKITLNGNDLYNIEMGKIRGMNYNIIDSLNDLYFDQLKSVIEKTGKVALSL